jgi:hypothetical protein
MTVGSLHWPYSATVRLIPFRSISCMVCTRRLLSTAYGVSQTPASTPTPTSWTRFPYRTVPPTLGSYACQHRVRQGSLFPVGLPRLCTASRHLAGEPCNAYGTGSTRWSSPATDRLNIQINPTYVDVSYASWYLLPEDVVPSPRASSNVSPAKVILRAVVERSVATSK